MDILHYDFERRKVNLDMSSAPASGISFLQLAVEHMGFRGIRVQFYVAVCLRVL